MRQLRLSLFLILILLLAVLTGCNQPAVRTGPDDQNRLYQYPKTLEEIGSLFQEHGDEFELFAANCLKNLTTETGLEIRIFSGTHQYQYWTTTKVNAVAPELQSVSKLIKGEEIFRFLRDFPVKEVRAEDTFVGISLYDAEKYDGNLAMQQTPDYITYKYLVAGGLLLENEIMEKSG